MWYSISITSLQLGSDTTETTSQFKSCTSCYKRKHRTLGILQLWSFVRQGRHCVYTWMTCRYTLRCLQVPLDVPCVPMSEKLQKEHYGLFGIVTIALSRTACICGLISTVFPLLRWHQTGPCSRGRAAPRATLGRLLQLHWLRGWWLSCCRSDHAWTGGMCSTSLLIPPPRWRLLLYTMVYCSQEVLIYTFVVLYKTNVNSIVFRYGLQPFWIKAAMLKSITLIN